MALDAAVQAANVQADQAVDCVFAKNLVAGAIREIILRHRNVDPLQYIVLVGNDDVVPFFRYPDNAGLAKESNYYPPVKNDTFSQASLRSSHILSQDAYGATSGLNLHGIVLPLPDLAVGRLVESPGDIIRMLDSYQPMPNGLLPTPMSSFVSGYDFMVDAARAIQTEFKLAVGEGETNTHDALLAADPSLVSDLNPQGVMAPDDPNAWTATHLRESRP
jgi:hypothetical protein